MYQQLKKVSDRLGERRDCAVKALAVVCDVPYEKAHAALAKAGRRNKRGTFDYMYDPALRELGYRRRLTTQFKSRTVRTLEREIPCGKRFLIFTRGHVLPARHGEIHDWAKGTKKHVQSVYRVEKLNA